MFEIDVGTPKLGNFIEEDGTNFGIFSQNATKVKINFFQKEDDSIPFFSYELDGKLNKTENIWHIKVLNLPEKTFYTWSIDGPKDSHGHCFNYFNHLMDPYGKSITTILVGVPPKTITLKQTNQNFKNVTTNIEFKDSIIYELQVKLFTKNSNSGVKNPGTYESISEKISYLKNLGITTVELLPIFEFDENTVFKDPSTKKKLKNTWGYNPISFFSPSKKFSTSKNPADEVNEFKAMVSALHQAGIQVILDVVYNHTAESGEKGPIYNFKGIDNSLFYMMTPDQKFYMNYSGTGNTFNCNTEPSKKIILDSLRYWHLEMGVDGFRFDLAPILGRNQKGEWIGPNSILSDIQNDIDLKDAILISESWDASGGYFLGDFPIKWSEWNGKFRDNARKFIRGDFGQVPDLIKRILGSPDIFPSPEKSLNFITCHDGFTMWDLVSYNQKNNFDNGENNNDGENNNFSFNCGFEGETTDERIITLRKKQIKNFLVLLLMSQGIPMLLMGDEIGRTQFGNNNAYSQDNEKVWFDWDKIIDNRELFFFAKNMIRFRKRYDILRNNRFFLSDTSSPYSITLHGTEPNAPDLSYYSRNIGIMFIDSLSNTNIYLAFNSSDSMIQLELPQLNNQNWYRVVDTSKDSGFEFLNEPEFLDISSYKLAPRSSIILVSK
ncbi:MAG: isoamylase [Cetobacterium sp.]|uniref:glycogen debranching protein n=1 Tax=Cetobacterium sp. TaxID=2071632 RepID=UPI002FCA002A